MKQSSDKDQREAKVYEVKTFTVPFASGEIKESLTTSLSFKEQLINKAFKFHSEGNISEAANHYQLFIDQGFKDYRVFSK